MTEPNNGLTIIENTQKARKEHGYAWGGEDVILSPQYMQALQDGKCVAFYDGEYVTFLSTQEPTN